MRSPMAIVPRLTGRKPAIARSRVVLPQPELPTMQPIAPGSSVKLSASTTAWATPR